MTQNSEFSLPSMIRCHRKTPSYRFLCIGPKVITQNLEFTSQGIPRIPICEKIVLYFSCNTLLTMNAVNLCTAFLRNSVASCQLSVASCQLISVSWPGGYSYVIENMDVRQGLSNPYLLHTKI